MCVYLCMCVGIVFCCVYNLATVRAVHPLASPTFNIGAPQGPGPSKVKRKNVQGGFNPILNLGGEGGHLKNCKIESVNRLKKKAYALTRCHLTRPGHGDGPIAKDCTVVTPTLVQLYA